MAVDFLILEHKQAHVRCRIGAKNFVINYVIN